MSSRITPAVEEGMMDGALLVVWLVAGACMAAIVVLEIGPSLRWRRRTRRPPWPPG
jgi:hypothetical protein